MFSFGDAKRISFLVNDIVLVSYHLCKIFKYDENQGFSGKRNGTEWEWCYKI